MDLVCVRQARQQVLATRGQELGANLLAKRLKMLIHV